MRGRDDDTGPSREESETVPTICHALLGLAWLPADGELVRGAHKQKQTSPTHPQGRCLFMCRKNGGTNSVAEKKMGDTGGERGWGVGRIRDGKNKRQAEQKCK